MSNHKIHVEYDGGRFEAVCSCRQRSGRVAQRWEAEDWELDHKNLIERIRIHAGTGKNPSMKDQRDHYLKMENDPDVTDYDRGLWRQLREELDRRLNEGGRETVDEQLPLGDLQ